MKISGFVRWAGPAAIAGGVFMVFSDVLNLTIYVPGLGEAANTGYQAVGSGVILFALVLLLVGMIGLYAGRPKPGGPRVIEYGDVNASYILAEPEEPSQAETTVTRDRAGSERSERARSVTARPHRTARLTRRV